MSYDLMVFDPADAPRDRKHFREQYSRTIGWSEGHDHNDPSVTTPQLREWHEDIRKSYRNMNGPGAPTDDDLMKPGIEDRLAAYSFGHHAIQPITDEHPHKPTHPRHHRFPHAKAR